MWFSNLFHTHNQMVLLLSTFHSAVSVSLTASVFHVSSLFFFNLFSRHFSRPLIAFSSFKILLLPNICHFFLAPLSICTNPTFPCVSVLSPGLEAQQTALLLRTSVSLPLSPALTHRGTVCGLGLPVVWTYSVLLGKHSSSITESKITLKQKYNVTVVPESLTIRHLFIEIHGYTKSITHSCDIC